MDNFKEPQEKKEQILQVVHCPLQSLALLDVDISILDPIMKKNFSGTVRFGHAEEAKKKVGGRMPAFPSNQLERQGLFDYGTAI